MYTLRMIRKKLDKELHELSRGETNINLGKSYSVIKNTNADEFFNQVKEDYPDIDTQKVRVIVNDEDNFGWFLDFNEPNSEYVNEYYIMTDTGNIIGKTKSAFL
jgi:hypothetical protein